MLTLRGKPGLGHKIVASFLLESEAAMRVLQRLELRVPDVFDEIIRGIIPKYANEEHGVPFDDASIDFQYILDYLKDCKPSQSEQIGKSLKNATWLIVKHVNGERKYVNPTKTVVYYPLEDLRMYFGESDSIYWVDVDYYRRHFSELLDIDLKYQLELLGVEQKPCLFPKEIKEVTDALLKEYGFTDRYSTRGKSIDDYKLHGLEEALARIDFTLSRIIASYVEFHGVTQKAIFRWFYSTKRSDFADSTYIRVLKENSWVFSKDMQVCKPSETDIKTVHPDYAETFSDTLLKLGAKVDRSDERLANLSEEERTVLSMFHGALNEGLTKEELEDLINQVLVEKKRKSRQASSVNNSEEESSNVEYDDTVPEDLGRKWLDRALLDMKGRQAQKTGLRSEAINIPNPFVPNTAEDGEDEIEQDEMVPNMVDPVQRKRAVEEKKINELTLEIELEAKRAETEEVARNSEMYTFAWFNALLALEDSHSTEDRVRRNPIRVTFGKASLDEDGTLLLSETAYIPQAIEDMGELQIVFYTEEHKRTAVAEVVSPQHKILKIKLKSPDSLQGFDLKLVKRAVVEVSSADFILEKLKNAFRQLAYADDLNLHDALPTSISFVFGPPGTGKTTYLSKLIGGLDRIPMLLAGDSILPLMQQEDKKVLVLTPTNKAADVLVEKIMENHTEAGTQEYLDWLVRFGETKSDTILDSSVFINDRKLSSSVYGKCTLVTTIARYPYDSFKILRAKQDPDEFRVRDFAWDYIIFDEASMINLASIVYVLYYAQRVNPNIKFIIGGDPFQIHPVIKFDWPGWSYLSTPAFNSDGSPRLDDDGQQINYRLDAGNIYSMVGLIQDDSFANPQTTPHAFPVHNLTKQYRSIVPLGSLFSHFRYSGQLEHDRTPEQMAVKPDKAVKPIELKGLPLQPITIIHFPIRKYESICRARSVKGSPYHIYSALFVVELLQYMQQNAVIPTDKPYKIGVICPYRTQESIINKMVDKLCKGPLEVVTGTVHGFQGDQCDMVLTLFNPPTKISRGTRTFLNKKNILNVAISRSKDYLLLLVPHDEEGEVPVKDLHQIEWIKSLARSLPDVKPHLKEYLAVDIEPIFSDKGKGIRDISFPTAHQNVNIYTKPAKKYEIRFDENAVDVQVEVE